MAAGKINLQKASGGITAITGVDGTGNTQLVLPESGTVATTAGATETLTGLIELATTAETQAGTDDTRAITPLKLKNSVIGLGQTWQDVTASRALGTTYTNSTGKPITISVSILWHSNNANYDYITVNGVIVAKLGTDNSSTTTSVSQLIAVVPDGGTYSVTASRPFKHWAELR